MVRQETLRRRLRDMLRLPRVHQAWVSTRPRSIAKFEENKRTALIKDAGHPRLL